MESFLEAWDLICDYCKKQVTDVSYETWFSKLVPISLDFGAGVAIIQAPNEFNKSTIERGFHKCLNDAVQSVFGEAFTYKLITPMEKKEKERVPDDDEYEYTFETFIEGSSNKFACAACRYVAKEPAKNYNPLFIYGNSGLGKTHLLNAIGHELKKNFPDKDIIYVKGDQFANELIEAIRAGTTVSFREKYRKADALLIDDIQFIAGKESTQEEFFHTFNTLHTAGKQIILTSDRPPQEIARLEDRLKSRFAWGLTCDIKKPDVETRIAILREKARQENITMDEDVYEAIATRVESNIRELEGSLTRLVAYAQLTNRPITVQLCEEALHDIFAKKVRKEVTAQVIMQAVANYYSITVDDLIRPTRRREIAVPRQIAMYITRDLTNLSLPQIGQVFGNRDHTTVLHGCNQIANAIKNDPSMASVVNDLKEIIVDNK